ncbi:MAG: hypothetical protein WCJ58_01425 [bacterium]
MKKKLVILATLVILFFGVIILLIPIKVTCGIPGATCTTAPDSNGTISRNIDVEPLFVYLIETIIHEDLPIKYSTQTETENVSR